MLVRNKEIKIIFLTFNIIYVIPKQLVFSIIITCPLKKKILISCSNTVYMYIYSPKKKRKEKSSNFTSLIICNHVQTYAIIPHII